MKKQHPKRTLFWSVGIKVLVFALLIYALYKQVYTNEQVRHIPDQFIAYDSADLILLALGMLMLMLLNWGLEARKWQVVILRLLPMRFYRAFKAVWTGVTLGLFTPNRVGEFGGRILYVPRRHRIQAAIVSLIGSFSQNLITVIVGMCATLAYIHRVEQITWQVTLTLAMVGAIAALLLVIAYYNLDVVITIFKRNKYLQRVYSYTTILQEYNGKDLSHLLLLAFLRYSVYTAQYLIFLNIFGAGLNTLDGVAAIAVIFLAQTVVPSFAIADLLTRLPVAALILNQYNVSVQVTLAATTSIWILNLIIPAVLGYVFIIRFNIFKNRQS